MEAIVADLDTAGTPSTSPSRTGSTTSTSASVVRTANAFLAAECTSSAGAGGTGAARWSPTATSTSTTTRPSPPWPSGLRERAGLALVGIDNLPGSVAARDPELPRACVLLFGQEGPGLSDGRPAACATTLSIAQFGSTRSINAGAAAAIAMHTWVRPHADLSPEGDAWRG